VPSISRRPDGTRPAPALAAPTLTAAQRTDLLYWLKLDRALETRLAALFKQGKVLGGLYRSLGQEAISVGSGYALEPGDWFAPVIRNMGTCLVRGVHPRILFSQYMARQVPIGGRDNALHFGSTKEGMVSTISPLGGLVSVMAGVALGFKMRGEKRVALTYSGDGQTSTGQWHEGVAFAAALVCPLILVIENNGWAYSTPVSRQSRLKDLAEKARAYGIPGEVVDGNDVEAVHEATRRAVDRARAGEGPTLIEAKTFRRLGHSEHDDPRKSVPAEEFEFWEKRDPIDRQEKRLLESGTITREGIATMERKIEALLEESLAWAEAVPPPDPSTLTRGVYAED
jgi:pyruvate dehydrogenase E1 component alpha subunit/2-oxoisovalerate dehydrogenase E1 component alpha subunit